MVPSSIKRPERAEKGSKPMFCSRCGAQISDKSAFCPSCGKPVQQQSAQPQFHPNDPQSTLHRSTNPTKISENGSAYHQQPQGYAPGMYGMQQNADQSGFGARGIPTQQGHTPQNAAPVGQKPGKGTKIFLFAVLFLILGAGFTVGGIFIGKALQASDQDASSAALASSTALASTETESTQMISSDSAYAEGEFTYSVNPRDIRVEIDAKDGKHIQEIRLFGVGNIDRLFPKYYDNQQQYYSWNLYFHDILVSLYFEGKGEKGNIHPSEMQPRLKVYRDPVSSSTDAYDIHVEIKDNEIIFRDIEIPNDANFDLYKQNWGCDVFIFRNEDIIVDVDDVELIINNERYDYTHHCLPSQLPAESTEAATERMTEAPTEITERATTEAAAGFNPSEENYFIQGTYLSSDPNLAGGSESTLIFYPNGSFYMNINFGEGFCEYNGTYTTSKKQSEMDDIYVYMTFNNTTNGIPKNATVVFSDTCDYCEFLTAGFGLIGYGDPPYGFSRQ